jgi:hypothetical protein
VGIQIKFSLRQGKRIGNCYVAKQLQLVGCAGCVDGKVGKVTSEGG